MKDFLRLLEEHHTATFKESGDQLIGDCVFCGKLNHFYINKDKGLWDCKVCGSKGNINSFIYQLGMVYHKNLFNVSNYDKLKTLSNDRGLPINALKAWYVGWDEIGKRYTIPVITGRNSCTDIRLYNLKLKTRSSAGAKTGLINFHNMIPDKPIYICEGEWDGIALDWLLQKLKIPATVVAVPGANTFKKDWIYAFRNCHVQVLYDNDNAGELGELRIHKALVGVAKSLSYINWVDALPDGFDLRDWIKHGIKVKKLRGCWRNLKKMFVKIPRLTERNPGENKDTKEQTQDKLKDVDVEKELESYRKWLHLPDKYILDIMFGTIFANTLMSGDPVWMFLVAPPGGSKSELLMSLAKAPNITCLTSLTPHSLISGFTFGGGGKDPSLLPQLDGKILVLKDFTTITSMHFTARDEIFGILRDAYDGKTEKQFGTGVRREYESKFGILAGTTPIIDTLSTVHQSLGERFLKYRIKIDSQQTEEKKIFRAISNINNELTMREDLQAAATRILSKEDPEKMPSFSNDYLKKVISLAQFCAKMRGVVLRDKYTQQVLYRPSSEVGTRLAKQLMKLAIGIGIFRSKAQLDKHEYACITRVAIHTCPERLVCIIKVIYKSRVEDGIEELTTAEISNHTRLPNATVFRLLEDLYLLKIVRRKGEGAKFRWSLEFIFNKLMEDAEVFS